MPKPSIPSIGNADGSKKKAKSAASLLTTVNANGNANLTVTDISGKVAMNSAITLENGSAKVNIDALDAGVYVFNVELENGLTSQFNVVKR